MQSDTPDTQSPALPDGWLAVESLDIEAQGIAHRPDGKVVFIEGALPFEQVSVSVHRRKNNWEAATATAIHRESSQRVRPGCPHFGLHAGACGGCKMQHLHESAQVAIKQRVLEDNLWHLGKVKAETLLRPIEGPAWGYRYRARLSVRHVHKKGEVLIGFHERKSRYVADMKVCHVLPPHVSALLMPLRDLIFHMEARETCPQIELACGDEVTALVLRQVLGSQAAAHGHLLIELKGDSSMLSVEQLLKGFGPSGSARDSVFELAWSQRETLPATYPFVLAFPLHMEIITAPVSVCHQVSTIGVLLPPITS